MSIIILRINISYIRGCCDDYDYDEGSGDAAAAYDDDDDDDDDKEKEEKEEVVEVEEDVEEEEVYFISFFYFDSDRRITLTTHYSNVTWASRRLKQPVEANKKIKASPFCPFLRIINRFASNVESVSTS